VTENKNINIEVYSDGSCNPQLNIGGWASIILYNQQKIILEGKELNTTHNRMELLAVINSIKYIFKNLTNFNCIKIYSDSQYVVRLNERKEKLLMKNFITKKGNILRNSDLLSELINFMQMPNIEFVKVKAHQKPTQFENYNIEVDKIVRKIVRDAVSQINK